MEKQNENPEASSDTRANLVPSQAKILLEWAAMAYRQTEKTRAWYLAMGLAVLVMVIYFAFFSDQYGWVVAISLLIMAGSYYVSEMKNPPAVRVTISDHGIRFGAKYFPFNEIKSFWIHSDKDQRNLHLTIYKGINRDVTIMIGEEVNMAKLRDYLLLQLAEEEGRKESFTDQIIHNLGL